MNVKRFLGLGLLLCALTAPAMADKFDDLAMINVVMTDENDLTWELVDNTPSESGKSVLAKVNSLIADGRYIESVSPTFGNMALIVHRPNTRGIKQMISTTYEYHKDVEKDIKKKFKAGFSVKYIGEGGKSNAFIVYDKNAAVTKQEFPTKNFEKLNAEGFYLRPLFVHDYSFAQNGMSGNAVQQANEVYMSSQGAATGERLIKGIENYKNQGWMLSNVLTYGDTYRAVFDKSALADRQITLIFSSKEELEDFIGSGITNHYLITTQWETATTALRKERAESVAKAKDSGSGWAEALGYFGKAFATGAQMVGQIKGIGSSGTSSAVATTESATSSSSKKTKKTTSTTSTKQKPHNPEAYRNYARAYDGYETQLIKMRSNGGYTEDEVRDIQKKMKQIRAKIAELGFTRAVSDVENWDP